MHAPLILIAEDDEELRKLVADRLRSVGFEVNEAATGTAAIEQAASRLPDIVLLDIMLPGMDGIEVCRRLRGTYPLLVIMMLTARSDEMDRVVGLEVGADDYITKPFSLQELVARVRAVARRLRLTAEQASHMESGQKLNFGDLEIDPVKREVRLRGEEIHLTVREFDLLLYLSQNPDRPFTRSHLLAAIWDIHYEGYDRTVDSHIQRLRAKIEDEPANPHYIRTVWGVGYKFQAHADNG